MSEELKVGDEVTWVSQAAGTWKKKTGKIVEVVKPRSRPATISHSGGHKHTTYVVDVGGKVYWPLKVARTSAPRVVTYPGKGNPWADFLHHRARVLRMWREEGKTAAEALSGMQMDLGQVRLILMTVDEHPEEYES